MGFNFKQIWIILIESIKEAMRWKVWKWLLTGSLGTALSYFQLGKNFLGFDLKCSLVFAAGFIVILFIARLVLIFFIKVSKYYHEVYKNSTYGEAIVILKESFARIHRYRKTPGHQDAEFISAMITICDNLKKIYDKITNSECSVSLKVPLSDNKVDEKTVLMNLTRDRAHNKRDTDTYKNIKHTLIGNTAFFTSFSKVIKNSPEKYYINNQVNKTENYLNTSKDCYEDGIFPYNSELVHPIVPAFAEDDSKNYDCHGFICIDSTKGNAFNGKYDAAIIEGVVDGIYDIISERNNYKYSKDGK